MTFESDVKSTPAERAHPLLKMALELGPMLIFFFANLRGPWLIEKVPALAVLGGPLLVATGLFMAATVISLVVSKILLGHLPIMPFVSGIVVVIFGTLSIWLQNETFIKMKPTIVNTLFGAVLLGGLLFGRSLLGYVFNAAFQLDEEGWRKLTLRWGLFFLVLAVMNEVVWRNFSDDFWVAFKVWGTMPITIAFTLAQMPLIMRHSLTPPEKSENGKDGETR
ncbi:septation protein A [Rhizobium rhizosphaerae]|uniref:Inner membrane-spanning protein YciB n=1 Tax=Xaviernesmea rhizosphaerae TaxID=1672749 RepID=A0A1Q9AL80_9HYPH|nr:septation protein A [Xaviernesmea rhizosphaerae]OLP56094.1 septation protein A [Xaviernesmea rhizosphaerae]